MQSRYVCTVSQMILTSLLLLAAASRPETIHVNVDGEDRQALVFKPDNTSSKLPLVFGFHGHGGGMTQASRSFDLQDAWPNALVVYPDGVATKTFYDRNGGMKGWSPDKTNNNRDIKFFDALYKKVTSEYQVDTHHVYAMGHSNGAQFIYILWSLRGNQFAALGSCEGAGARTVQLQPKPFFVTIGDADEMVPPAVQHRSLEAVFQVEGSAGTGTSYGEKGMLYSGTQPVVLWAYHGPHKFPADCVPSMVKFFQSH